MISSPINISVPGIGRALVVTLFVILSGCANSKKHNENAHDKEQAAQANRQKSVPFPKASLAPDVTQARTIQLYRGKDQTALPVLRLRGRNRLSLEFDLMGHNNRPLSIYFYHADREWKRDLSPSRYMQSYRRDKISNYESSRSTQKPYVHYEYGFPNDDIGFEMSGNYILRVTEQGEEDKVLFERSFFISEQNSSSDFRLRKRRLGNNALPGLQPVLLFQPPQSLSGESIFNYNTCFVPNGRLREARCTSRPRTLQQEGLRFDLDPRHAFQMEAASYGLDLSTLSPGGAVLEVNRRTTPPTVYLEDDDVRFPGASETVAFTGQTVLAEEAADEDLFGEYVQTHFRFIPPNQQALRQNVYLSGSFNGWLPSEDYKLTWQPDKRRYEGSVLLKQGQYAYRYMSEDASLRRVFQQSIPQTRNLFTALIYYHDLTEGTDRLLSVQQALVQ